MQTNHPFIQIQGVEMVYKTRKGSFKALEGINLDIRRGEFISLIGHSGCGKSTLLNLVAGLLKPSQGALLCDQREIAGPGPERAVVFQNHSLLPWLSCLDNVLLAVETVFAAKEARPRLVARAQAALELVGMAHAAYKRPHEISGGMKQRVGIARALAMEPKVLLMDEPFGALDALTRAHLQDELLKIVATTRSTVLMVTHDVDEAVLLSDRIVMMSPPVPEERAAILSRIQAVPIARPRDRVQLAEDPVYLQCRKAVIDFLYAGHARSQASAEHPREAAQEA